MHNAEERVWPLSYIRGCRFHLGQSWWKKIQNVGFSQGYKDSNSKISIFLKMFFGLPFLKPNEVSECFIDDIMPLQPNYEEVKIFTDYVLSTYIDEMEATFPPTVCVRDPGKNSITESDDSLIGTAREI